MPNSPDDSGDRLFIAIGGLILVAIMAWSLRAWAEMIVVLP